MKLIIFSFLLIFIPFYVSCNESSENTQNKEDCAKYELLEIKTKFLDFREEFSKQLAKIETKHREEMNTLKSQLAEVKMKQSEELAKIATKHFEELANARIKHSEEMNELKSELLDEKKQRLNELNAVKEKQITVKEEFLKAKNELENMKSQNDSEEKPAVIFSVFSNNSETLSSDSFIGFTYDFLGNSGETFDLENGIFTAPYKGIYEFSFSGNTVYDGGCYIKVLRNQLEINAFYANTGGQINISPTWIISLEKGDTTRLKLDRRTRLFTDGNMYRTFSGKLLSHLP